MTTNVYSLPSSPGTYILLLHKPVGETISVGKLGQFLFPAGYYLYTGSALGPGGLAGRLTRHLSPIRKDHWHIDYLRRQARLTEIWYTESPTRLEHTWAALLESMPGVSLTVPRFGASDCRCSSHLFYQSTPPSFRQFQQIAAADSEGDTQIPHSRLLIPIPPELTNHHPR